MDLGAARCGFDELDAFEMISPSVNKKNISFAFSKASEKYVYFV